MPVAPTGDGGPTPDNWLPGSTPDIAPDNWLPAAEPANWLPAFAVAPQGDGPRIAGPQTDEPQMGGSPAVEPVNWLPAFAVAFTPSDAGLSTVRV
ncbi:MULTISPECIES: hypothetical protein [unclassified Streptomyces]|uniref:hypothetical protein n=1 Tax=unclassified Streptomyces TaxID=2593676 RepID=UPI000B86E7B8|nr:MULTISPECIES: hypothetical protein [unclassified Streptomyces]MYS24565.1 hypothetical protein [Streptomyces sp. SID4948]